MKKIEHIGIAVKDLKTANNLYSKLLNTAPYKMEEVESENVNTSFFQVGESKIELLEGTSSDSPISKFIDKKGEGVHHIAFEVDDVEKVKQKLLSAGGSLHGEVVTFSVTGKGTVTMVYTRDPEGNIVELQKWEQD